MRIRVKHIIITIITILLFLNNLIVIKELINGANPSTYTGVIDCLSFILFVSSCIILIFFGIFAMSQIWEKEFKINLKFKKRKNEE